MLRHIVMMKFNQLGQSELVAVEMKESLMALTKTVGSLIKMEVGLNANTKPNGYGLALTADFEDEDGLNAYRVHPNHVKILKRMQEIVDQVAAVDYYI